MNLVDIQIAARSLAQHKRRTLFLGAAIGAVTMLLVSLNALTDGIQRTILETASTLMTGHVNIGGFYKPSAGAGAPLVSDYRGVWDKVKDKVPELDYWTARGRGYAKGVSDTGTMDLIVGGLDVTTEQGFRKVVKVLDGKLEDFEKPGTIFLFETQAKRLGVKAGDVITLSAPTARGMSNTADVRVAAVGKDIGLLSVFNAYVPGETLRSLYQLKEGSTGAIHLYLKDHRQAPAVAARLREALAGAGYRVMEPDGQAYFMKLMNKINREDWTGQKLDVSTWEDEMSFMSQTLQILTALTTLLVLLLSVVVAVGIMNTLWIAIRERTREIGTLRAIGMQRSKVRNMFLLESFMLGLGSTVAGSAAAILLGAAINALKIGVPESVQMFLMADHLRLSFQAGGVVTSIVLLTLLTTTAAFFPSLRAARLKPVTAMHHIG